MSTTSKKQPNPIPATSTQTYYPGITVLRDEDEDIYAASATAPNAFYPIRAMLSNLFALIEAENGVVDQVRMHPQTYKLFENLSKLDNQCSYDVEQDERLRTNGLRGYIWNAGVFIDETISEGDFVVIRSPDTCDV